MLVGAFAGAGSDAAGFWSGMELAILTRGRGLAAFFGPEGGAEPEVKLSFPLPMLARLEGLNSTSMGGGGGEGGTQNHPANDSRRKNTPWKTRDRTAAPG